MNTALWVTQVTLAVIFVVSALLKGTQSKARLVASGQTGVSAYPTEFIRFIAACELVGAAGLILPWWTGIARVLTPTSASLLAIIMSGAAASHAVLAANNPREWRNVATNLVLLVALVFVTVGRA